MTQRIHDRIREAIENTPGLTQKGLSERMGLNPAAVNRMLYGRRNIMAEEIPMIEDYIGLKLDLSSPASSMPSMEYRQREAAARRGFADPSGPPIYPRGDVPFHSADGKSSAQMIPVYGRVGTDEELNLSLSDIVDWAPRHPALFGIPTGFAFYAVSAAMEPRYSRGELVYIHPGRPVEPGKDCLVEMKDGVAVLRRLLRRDEGAVRVAQLNPAEETEIPADQIRAVYLVVGRG